MVRTGSNVETIVGATRYPPTGMRSVGPLRASRYGQDYDDFLNRVNDNVLVAIIVETKEAIENLDQVPAVLYLPRPGIMHPWHDKFSLPVGLQSTI